MVSTHLAIMLAICWGPADPPPSTIALEVEPGLARLRGPDQRVQLIVTGRSSEGTLVDLTSSAHYRVADPNVALIDPDGLICPRGDGSTTIEVSQSDRTHRVEVVVSDFAGLRPVHFRNEIVPIFSKYRCNAGGCHGKASGQNGFRLSLLGFDPMLDHESLIKEGRGRRVFPASPQASLLLKKPTSEILHGGGKRFNVGSPEYNTLARWIGQGAPFDSRATALSLIRLSVEPSSRVIRPQGGQQLRVVAHHEDGSTTDVTRLAEYQSNVPELAEVTSQGRVQTHKGVGDVAILARFGGKIGVARVTIPNSTKSLEWELPPSRNLIDPFVVSKLQELGLVPSDRCTDAEFARRSSLDLCGILPRPEDVIAFEKDSNPLKREIWVDRQIARPEYADLFAMKWSILLKNKRTLGEISQEGTFAFHGWIRQSLAENKPYDQFAAEIVAARGDPNRNPAVRWSLQTSSVEERADDTAQLFLGVRIQCARCHHHPSETWSQDDYYGFASLFARIGTKPGTDPASPSVYSLATGLAINPISGEARRPKPLGSSDLADLGPYRDPRDELVGWLKRPDNPYFARALVNRYWKHFLGRGLVEPEDDLRVSNPPTHPELLQALADDFVDHGYDLKRLVRMIATSQAYDRSSLPNDSNGLDRRNFARYDARRLPAEVLLDALGVVTGSPETFSGLPESVLAIQLPDDGFASDFLDIFGRPKRETVCDCERSNEANLSQTLHLINSDELDAKLTRDTARAATLALDPRPESLKVEELYRLALARQPSVEERAECLSFLQKRKSAGNLREGFEDLIWTLINTKEFLFNH